MPSVVDPCVFLSRRVEEWELAFGSALRRAASVFDLSVEELVEWVGEVPSRARLVAKAVLENSTKFLGGELYQYAAEGKVSGRARIEVPVVEVEQNPLFSRYVGLSPCKLLEGVDVDAWKLNAYPIYKWAGASGLRRDPWRSVKPPEEVWRVFEEKGLVYVANQKVLRGGVWRRQIHLAEWLLWLKHGTLGVVYAGEKAGGCGGVSTGRILEGVVVCGEYTERGCARREVKSVKK